MASARPERQRRAGRRQKAHTSDHPPLLFDQIILFVLFILNFQIFLMFKSFKLVMWTKSFISSAVLYLHLWWFFLFRIHHFFSNKTMHVWSVSNNPLKGVMHCTPAVGIMSKREEEVDGLSRQRWDKTFPPANAHSASNWTPRLWDNAIKPNGFVGNREGRGKKRWHYEVIENNSEVKRWFKQR